MEFNVNFKWYDDERIWLATFSSDKFALTLDHVSFEGLDAFNGLNTKQLHGKLWEIKF